MQELATLFHQRVTAMIELLDGVMKDADLTEHIDEACVKITEALADGRRLLICGNGGSAADAQHFAAELTGRFKHDNRRPLPCIALTVDTSALTAIANDFGFDEVFSRQVEALATPGDVLIGISTSGNSENIVRAVKLAQDMGVYTIGLLGRDGGKLSTAVGTAIVVPSRETDLIQQVHLIIEHFMCQVIDDHFVGLQ